MIELYRTIRRIGVKEGIIEIRYASADFDPVIIINFYDEDTDVDFLLESINLGEFCPTKESYVIEGFDLRRIKNSEDATAVEKLLNEKGKKIKPQVITRANELAAEIHERAGIRVKVVPKLQGRPEVLTVYAQNMWHARQVLAGINDDY